MAFLPSGKELAITLTSEGYAPTTGAIHWIDLETGLLTRTLTDLCPTTLLAIDPTGQKMATADYSRVRLWVLDRVAK